MLWPTIPVSVFGPCGRGDIAKEGERAGALMRPHGGLAVNVQNSAWAAHVCALLCYNPLFCLSFLLSRSPPPPGHFQISIFKSPLRSHDVIVANWFGSWITWGPVSQKWSIAALQAHVLWKEMGLTQWIKCLCSLWNDSPRRCYFEQHEAGFGLSLKNDNWITTQSF